MVKAVVLWYEFNTVHNNRLSQMPCCCQLDVNHHSQVFALLGR